ncbi:Pregnancy-associated plasma protein-A [Nocardioides dokdonensis FR1436]|uniref:Pregnancy-associated plasma protein-A n=1 Tax=Nocardioides dokdonensis FR1436 TaxID=1300347 RepID=A0A1A9GMX9_9ACTN|nr:zinc metalloprotease [Nocardioides dokdonensis]ANH39020.1 Pregnancy-associated plasma protein-A [Nocardioides dokdonensis FR1436]
MGLKNRLSTAASGAATTVAAGALVATGLLSPASAHVAQEAVAPRAAPCIDGAADGTEAARGGPRGADHRDVSVREQQRIEREVGDRLAARGLSRRAAAASSATVPVYVHVMRDSAGGGDVTDSQVQAQVDVLNRSFAGQKSSTATDTGFRFTLAGIDRFDNTSWHQDKQSSTYRRQTRQGGANALNIWLVDFAYLGVATFPWDYSRNGAIDGIRVNYTTLPGGSASSYNLGETATHEAGHWFGLYHTFQGGCTTTNDQVADTPAQSSSTSGCPAGRDSCSLPGLDPIHNFMDYSYDSCYLEFTGGQSDRAGQMWAAYR